LMQVRQFEPSPSLCPPCLVNWFLSLGCLQMVQIFSVGVVQVIKLDKRNARLVLTGTSRAN
jgi:hypothetical protein